MGLPTKLEKGNTCDWKVARVCPVLGECFEAIYLGAFKLGVSEVLQDA